MRKFSITFTCPACGLMTPSVARVPDSMSRTEGPIQFEQDCFHCGEDIARVATLRELTELPADEEAEGDE